MENNFDYTQAKEEAERMLEVIERDPQLTINPTWSGPIGNLVGGFMALAIGSACLGIATKSLKGIIDSENHNQQTRIEIPVCCNERGRE